MTRLNAVRPSILPLPGWTDQNLLIKCQYSKQINNWSSEFASGVIDKGKGIHMQTEKHLDGRVHMEYSRGPMINVEQALWIAPHCLAK